MIVKCVYEGQTVATDEDVGEIEKQVDRTWMALYYHLKE